MDQPDTSIYVTCTRRKGQQKKHVAVCDSCRWQSSCESYRAHQLKKTQKNQDVLLTISEGPFIRKNLLNDIRRELRAVIFILADYPQTERSAGIIETNNALKNENLLEHLQNELSQLKSLFENILNHF
jgi:hypothetical protein